MNPLQDLKSEIKLFLIVAAISAIIAVGGVFLLKAMQPAAPAAGPAPRDQAELDFAGWQTFRNEEYGFEVQYPPEFEVEFEAVAFEDRKEPPGRHFLLAEIRPLLRVESEREEMNAISLSHAEMEAEFLRGAYGEGTVYYPGENATSRWSPFQQSVENGILSYTFREATSFPKEGVEKVGGHLAAIIEREGEGSFYLTLAGADCTDIAFSDCPEVKNEDKELFDKILSTFRFTP